MDDPKIIKTTDGWIDYGFNDLTDLASVKIRYTKLTVPMYKVKTASYIGLWHILTKGEVIKVGPLKKTYKIKYIEKNAHPKKGFIYRIERTDCAPITALDLDNANEEDLTIEITNRQSFEQLFNK